jgi:predicted nicotinamide N-methyase
MGNDARAFVRNHTHLRVLPGLDGLRLHLSDDVIRLWHAVQSATGDPDAALPCWGFAWAGGLAIARHLQAHPESVAGKAVFDLSSGSGLCAIAAMRAGAAGVVANDVDPLAAAAIGLNARANGVHLAIAARDVLEEPVPAVDVILAGDCWYERGLAERALPWLRRARDQGLGLLLGDPGRKYLPVRSLHELAAYDVRTTTDLEDMEQKRARVYTLRTP